MVSSVLGSSDAEFLPALATELVLQLFTGTTDTQPEAQTVCSSTLAEGASPTSSL